VFWLISPLAANVAQYAATLCNVFPICCGRLLWSLLYWGTVVGTSALFHLSFLAPQWGTNGLRPMKRRQLA